MTGTVNTPGTPGNPNGMEGMMLDNAATPGCENWKLKLNCFPMTWYCRSAANQHNENCPSANENYSRSGKPSLSTGKKQVLRGKCIKIRTTSKACE